MHALSQKVMACKYWSNYLKFTFSKTKYLMHILCLLWNSTIALKCLHRTVLSINTFWSMHFSWLMQCQKYRNWHVGAGVWSTGSKTSWEWSAKERRAFFHSHLFTCYFLFGLAGDDIYSILTDNAYYNVSISHTSPLVLGDFSLFTTSASSGLWAVLSVSLSFNSLARLFLPGYLSLWKCQSLLTI